MRETIRTAVPAHSALPEVIFASTSGTLSENVADFRRLVDQSTEPDTQETETDCDHPARLTVITHQGDPASQYLQYSEEVDEYAHDAHPVSRIMR